MINTPNTQSQPDAEQAHAMNFACSPDQLKLRESAIAFARNELNDDIINRDQEEIFSRELWQKCADYGIFSMGLGDQEDSPELDFLSFVPFMEGLGYGCRDNGLVFAINAQILTVEHPIACFGTGKQKKLFLPKMCSGEWIGAHALTERGSGSDVYKLQTRAEKCEGGYRLFGSKRLVTLAPVADLFLTFATTNPDLGKWGLTGFIVERNWDGVIVHPANAKMGLRTVPMGEVSFEGCYVPETHRLGKEGAGFSISTASLEVERFGILAGQLGAMERQLEESVAYAKETHRFGKPIGRFQSVSNRIVNMKLRLETARLLLYKVAWMKANDLPAQLESALLKLHLSECFLESSLDAIRNHGGDGYLTEKGIERDLRDSIGGVIYAGTSDIQRNVVAGLLGL